MDDTGGVDGREGLGGASGEGVEGTAGERTVGGQVLVEGRAWDVGRGQPRGLGVRVGREQGYEARSLDAGGKLDLTAKAGAELGVLGLRGVDDLDGDPQSNRIEPA